jgi:hypothetical protein
MHQQLSVFEQKQLNVGLGFKQQSLTDFLRGKFALDLQDFSAVSASPREAALDFKIPRVPRTATPSRVLSHVPLFYGARP